jgi:hypothetical protein
LRQLRGVFAGIRDEDPGVGGAGHRQAINLSWLCGAPSRRDRSFPVEQPHSDAGAIARRVGSPVREAPGGLWRGPRRVSIG